MHHFLGNTAKTNICWTYASATFQNQEWNMIMRYCQVVCSSWTVFLEWTLTNWFVYLSTNPLFCKRSLMRLHSKSSYKSSKNTRTLATFCFGDPPGLILCPHRFGGKFRLVEQHFVCEGHLSGENVGNVLIFRSYRIRTVYPIRSMYGIFTYIYHKNQPNVGKYTAHGSYGYGSNLPTFTNFNLKNPTNVGKQIIHRASGRGGRGVASHGMANGKHIQSTLIKYKWSRYIFPETSKHGNWEGMTGPPKIYSIHLSPQDVFDWMSRFIIILPLH